MVLVKKSGKKAVLVEIIASHLMGYLTFVIGGSRSGKSQFSENLALDSYADAPAANRGLYYLATALAFDDEMSKRIERHQERRNANWQTIDATIHLPAKIRSMNHQGAIILVDCLSVWTTNLLIKGLDIDPQREQLCDAISSSSARIICVASETGLGIVPDNLLSRQFRDANGENNQAMATLANDVYFMIASIAQKIKP